MDIEEVIDKYLGEDKEGSIPKGWDEESIQKFAKTIGKDPHEHGFFDACVLRLSKHIDDKETVNGICANVVDKVKGSTMWRSGNKHKNKS